MKPIVVYCAKQISHKEHVLVPTDVGLRAADVRQSIGRIYNAKNWAAGWKMALKSGWRVEPCIIESQHDWLVRQRQ